MKRHLVTLGAALALGSFTAVVAQTVEGLDLERIEANAAHHAAEVEALLSSAVERAKGSAPEAQEAVGEAREAVRRIDPASLPKAGAGAGAGGPVDLDEMVAGAQANLADPRAAPLFIAFVSLSMPEETLKILIADVRDAGGMVVLRGLPQNNGRMLAGLLRKVVDEKSAASVSIDPRLFRAFRVNAAPTFVAAGSDFTPCDDLDCVSPVPPHDRIAGNITVRYALERMAEARGPGAPVAQTALANLARR